MGYEKTHPQFEDLEEITTRESLNDNTKPDIAAQIQGRTAYEYLVDICLGKIGMQFDTGWCARGGQNPLEFIKRNEIMNA